MPKDTQPGCRHKAGYKCKLTSQQQHSPLLQHHPTSRSSSFLCYHHPLLQLGEAEDPHHETCRAREEFWGPYFSQEEANSAEKDRSVGEIIQDTQPRERKTEIFLRKWRSLTTANTVAADFKRCMENCKTRCILEGLCETPS